MEFLNNADNKNEMQYDVTNKLLLEMVKNQKQNIKNLIRVFTFIIICYTLLLISMVVGFFVYESQFEIEETETIRYEQEMDTDNGGNAIGIINNNGDWSYGESKTDSDSDEGKNEIKSK